MTAKPRADFTTRLVSETFDCPCGPSRDINRPGTATLPDGRRMCPPAAQQWEVESGAVAASLSGDVLSAYVKGDPTRADGRRVTVATSWFGNPLATIRRAHYGARIVRFSRHEPSYSKLYFTAQDASGAWWRGWGSSEHDLVTMRRLKVAPRWAR